VDEGGAGARLLGIPNSGGNSMSSKKPSLMSSSTSGKDEDERSDIRLGVRLGRVRILGVESSLEARLPVERLIELAELCGSAVIRILSRRDDADDFGGSQDSSSSPSNSDPVRLTVLFGLLLEYRDFFFKSVRLIDCPDGGSSKSFPKSSSSSLTVEHCSVDFDDLLARVATRLA